MTATTVTRRAYKGLLVGVAIIDVVVVVAVFCLFVAWCFSMVVRVSA